MKRTKRTLISFGILVIIVIALYIVNTFFYKHDPYIAQRKIPEDYIFETSHEYYSVFFYQLDCDECEEVEKDMQFKLTQVSNLYFCNLDDTSKHTIKIKNNFNQNKLDYTNWSKPEDIIIIKTPTLLTIKDGKVTNYTNDINEIKAYARKE